MNNLNDLAKQCYNLAKEKGFWDDIDEPNDTTLLIANTLHSLHKLCNDIEAIRNGSFSSTHTDFVKSLWRGQPSRRIKILSKLMLIVSEVAEAIDGIDDNLEEEMADIIIRCLDLIGFINEEQMKIDIDNEIERKLEHNTKRPRMHGKLA